MVVSGDLTFNPLKDELVGSNGEKFKVWHWLSFLVTYFQLDSPYGDELPGKGFDAGHDYYQPIPTENAPEVKVDPNSKRLALLQPFEPWDGKDILNAPVLIKAKGKVGSSCIASSLTFSSVQPITLVLQVPG